MALTPNQLKQLVIDRLTRVGSDRISGADLREVFNEVIDAMGAANVSATIPDWAAGLTFQTDGSDDGAFCVHPDTAGTVRIWKTKIDNNTGNEPPTAPETTENTNWIEASPSSSSALVEWSAGIYGEGLIIVFYNDAFYKLTVPTRPYESEDIEAEIIAGDWVLVGGEETHYRGTYTSLANLQSAVPSGNPGDYAIVDGGIGTDAQKYIWDDDDEEWIVSGGAPVENASETQEGIVEMSSDAEAAAGTNTGATGAPLVNTPSQVKAADDVRRTFTASAPSISSNQATLNFDSKQEGEFRIASTITAALEILLSNSSNAVRCIIKGKMTGTFGVDLTEFGTTVCKPSGDYWTYSAGIVTIEGVTATTFEISLEKQDTQWNVIPYVFR